MQFVYFIPGASAAPGEVLEGLGLAAILGRDVEAGATDAGPDGGRGCLIFAGEGPRARLAAEAGRMRWIPARDPDVHRDGETAYWIGYDRQELPTPADLQRAEILPGRALRLGDGHEWTVPIARQYETDIEQFVPAVPMRLTVDDEGRDAAEVVAGYAELWDGALAAWNECVRAVAEAAGEGRPELAELEPMPLAEAERICAVAIRTNYRAGRLEARALGLFDTATITAMLRTIADLDGFEEAAKNRRAPSPDGGG